MSAVGPSGDQVLPVTGQQEQEEKAKDPKKVYLDDWRDKIGIRNKRIRSMLSEFYGTAALRFIGSTANAQLILGKGDYTTLQCNLGWGFAIAFGVFLAWKTSGGHVNPAVTIVLFILGRISVIDSLLYCLAQTVGATFGALICYALYHQAINDFDGGHRVFIGQNGTGGIFASIPRPYLTGGGAFLDQTIGTAVLGLFVAFFCEPRNDIPLYLMPILFGGVAAMLGVCCSMNMGSPVNPASDFGARIAGFMCGYGTEIFTHNNYFFVHPLIAPMLGAVIGGYSYILIVGLHIPDLKQEAKPSEIPVEKKDLVAV